MWTKECVAEVEGQFKALALRRLRILCWMAIHINSEVPRHSAMIWGREEFCEQDAKRTVIRQSAMTMWKKNMSVKEQDCFQESGQMAVHKYQWGIKRCELHAQC